MAASRRITEGGEHAGPEDEAIGDGGTRQEDREAGALLVLLW